MKNFRSLLLVAAMALPVFAQAAPTLTVCIDNAAGGFNFGTATCVADNGAGDVVTLAGAITAVSMQTGGLTITSAIGEPIFSPGFGMSLSVDGTIDGAWIVGIAQTGLSREATPGAVTAVSADFTGSGGAAGFAVYVDDDNRGLSDWGPVGTMVTSGSTFGSGSGNVTLTDPFSMIAFVTFNSSGGPTFYSTDLTVRVPEPGSMALVGVALLGLAGAGRRRKLAGEKA